MKPEGSWKLTFHVESRGAPLLQMAEVIDVFMTWLWSVPTKCGINIQCVAMKTCEQNMKKMINSAICICSVEVVHTHTHIHVYNHCVYI